MDVSVIFRVQLFSSKLCQCNNTTGNLSLNTKGIRFIHQGSDRGSHLKHDNSNEAKLELNSSKVSSQHQISLADMQSVYDRLKLVIY